MHSSSLHMSTKNTLDRFEHAAMQIPTHVRHWWRPKPTCLLPCLSGLTRRQLPTPIPQLDTTSPQTWVQMGEGLKVELQPLNMWQFGPTGQNWRRNLTTHVSTTHLFKLDFSILPVGSTPHTQKSKTAPRKNMCSNVHNSVHMHKHQCSGVQACTHTKATVPLEQNKCPVLPFVWWGSWCHYQEIVPFMLWFSQNDRNQLKTCSP